MVEPLPEFGSISLGAELVPCTRRCFQRRFVGTGLLQVHRTEGGQPRFRLTDLERLLQRRFSAHDYLLAQRQLDKVRTRQRVYRQNLAVRNRGY